MSLRLCEDHAGGDGNVASSERRCKRPNGFYHYGMKPRHVAPLTFIAILAVSSLDLRGQAPARAVPLEPIDAILEAFRTHQVVALSEGAHGNVPGHLLRLALLRDPRFA